MADLAQKEQDAIAVRVAEAFASRQEGACSTRRAEAGCGAGGEAAASPKQFFCQNWPLIKTGLEIPEDLRPAADQARRASGDQAGDAAQAAWSAPSS